MSVQPISSGRAVSFVRTAATRLPPATDIAVLMWILAPAGAIAGLLWAVGATWPAAAVAGTAFAISVFICPAVGLYAYFAWQAVDSAFISDTGSVLTPAKVFAPFLLLVYVCKFGRTGTRMLVSKPFIMAMLAYAAYGAVLAPLSPEPSEAWRYTGQILVQALLVAMAVHVVNNRAFVGRAMVFTVIGGVVAASIMTFSGYDIGSADQRATIGEHANPNSTAFALSIALFAIPAAWGYVRFKVMWPIYLAAAPLIFWQVLQTGSRTGMVGVFAAASLGVFIVKRTSITKRIVVATICTMICVGVLAYQLESGALGGRAGARIESFVAAGDEDLGDNPRMAIWSLALQTFVRQPWGFGFGQTAYTLRDEQGWFIDIHSSWLGALVEGGVIGFTFFAWGMWHLVKATRGIARAHPGIAAAMMLCLLAMNGVAHTYTYSKWFWVPATLCLLMAEQAARDRAAEALAAAQTERNAST